MQEPLRRALFCVFLCSEVIFSCKSHRNFFRKLPLHCRHFLETPLAKNPKTQLLKGLFWTVTVHINVLAVAMLGLSVLLKILLTSLHPFVSDGVPVLAGHAIRPSFAPRTFGCCHLLQWEARFLQERFRNIPVTPTPSIFPEVLPYTWEAYCRTNGRRTAVQMGGVLQGFPFFEA